MTALGWAGFMAGGAIGASARYLLDGVVGARSTGLFPWGTFVVNLTGSLAAGLLVGAALYHALPTTLGAVVGGGFLGAFTTFSNFTFETVRLWQQGCAGRAAANALGTAVAGAAAAGAGVALALALA